MVTAFVRTTRSTWATYTPGQLLANPGQIRETSDAFVARSTSGCLRAQEAPEPVVTHLAGGFLLVWTWAYALCVPSVFVSAHGEHFHATKDCRWIATGQKARRSSAPVHAVPISSISGLQPCKSCYPDAPRAKFLKLRCKECKSARPCAHNGGVLVKIPVVWRRGSALIPKGAITYRRRYVWPDVAHFYDRVVETEKV